MKQKLIFRFTAIIYIIIVTFTMVRGYAGVRDWIPGFAILSLSLIGYPESFFNKETFFLLAYMGILALFAIAGHTLTDLSWIANETLPPLVCLSIINVFLYNQDFVGLKMITVTGLIIIVITALLTIPILLSDSNAVRNMVEIGVGKNDLDLIAQYHKKGIASFGLVSSLPFLYPLLVYRVKIERNTLIKCCYLFTIVVTFFMLVKASVATPLILSTVTVLFSMILSKNRNRNIVIGILISLLLIFCLNEQLIIGGLKAIKPTFNKTIMEKKIDDIVISIKQDKADGSVKRINSTIKSWNTFIESPFYGGFDKKLAGGHAYFIDRLAYFGLIGSFPFFLFLYFTFKKHVAFIEGPYRPYYIQGIVIFALLGFIKNIGSTESFIYLFIFLPGLCLRNK